MVQPRGLTDYEDVTAFTLDAARQEELLTSQNECSFVWATKDGWPVGVIMSYVWRDGRLWLTSSRQRKRVPAVRRDGRVSVIISGLGTPMGPGKTLTVKGRCTVREDDACKEWFYPALAAAIFPGNERRQQNFTRFLDSPGRVILEVAPVATISHDIDKLSAAASETLKEERAASGLSTKRSVD
jgi:general stress protein 26